MTKPYNERVALITGKGYLLSTVISCCTICNRAKSDLDIEEFVAWLNDLVGFHGGKHAKTV